ncbi:hypothetical protein SBRCBS47491_001994 [Sporothrix bragantina]|uniref:Peptidase S8/S53 domain-containing protein n=1 Tax=Sporothrix bragantina TaxID=671064 RepID=A0ABP0B380_9PEZI
MVTREAPVTSNGMAPTGKTLKKNTTETAAAALRQLAALRSTDEKPPEIAKCLGYNAVQNKVLKRRAHALHSSLAMCFHNDVRAPDRESVLKELLEGNDPDFDRPWDLALLLADGSQGLILHVLLDPSQFLENPSQYSFCRLRAFVVLLLELEPCLLEAFDKNRRTPLHCMMLSSSTEEEDIVSAKMPNASKEAIITYMCTTDGFSGRFRRLFHQGSDGREGRTGRYNGQRETRAISPPPFQSDSDVDSIDEPELSTCVVFGGICAGNDKHERLCCIRDCGIAVDSALQSLEEVASMGNGLQFHAVHAAIAEDIAFPQAVIDTLSACYYRLDSLGRSCLHLAVSMPFTHTKLNWAKSLARIVSIENVQIEWDETSKPYLDTQEWGCAGNSDLYLVFNWLKQTQGVRKVFQVSVNDFDDQCTDNVWRRHSDKAIVECLKGLNVETWDWQRADIPCSAISEAAGESVKTLYLYSSGLDAVLESWASPGGLPRLKNLERIYLYASQGLESREHAFKSATEFKATIQKNFEAVNGRQLTTVEFTMLQTQDQRAYEDGNNTNSANEHEANEWLRSMDQFAAFMDQVGKGDSKVPIKVALIDDGVKSSYRGLDDNILCGQSWPSPKAPQEKSKVPRVITPPKYNSSHTGHGTVMAWYIRRMCPRVKLCVAKLDPVVSSMPNVEEKVTFTVESVIKAIRWAIGKKVDIISMSWAIDDNVPSEIKKSLSQAVRAALDSNILIFCANPDKGAEYGNNLTYPYHLEKEHIFCIGAAGRNGKRWDWIDAKDKSCTYLLPGVDLDIHVESKQPILPAVSQPSPLAMQEMPTVNRVLRERCKQSGSSLACALASGLAAMILHCSRVAGATSRDIDYLRTYDGMKSALDSLYPDNGASAAAAGEGQWLPVSSLPSGRSFAHISSSDKRRTVLNERVASFLENMPDDYIVTVPSNGRVTRTPTLNSNN